MGCGAGRWAETEPIMWNAHSRALIRTGPVRASCRNDLIPRFFSCFEHFEPDHFLEIFFRIFSSRPSRTYLLHANRSPRQGPVNCPVAPPPLLLFLYLTLASHSHGVVVCLRRWFEHSGDLETMQCLCDVEVGTPTKIALEVPLCPKI